jgi:hypothetical protein
VERDREIAAVRERLERLESEKTELQANLKRLLSAAAWFALFYPKTDCLAKGGLIAQRQ